MSIQVTSDLWLLSHNSEGAEWAWQDFTWPEKPKIFTIGFPFLTEKIILQICASEHYLPLLERL